MKRIKIMGLCLVAVFAMTAAAAASASAAEPAFYECKKVVGGKYEKGCKKLGVGKTAAYEIVEGVGKGKAFKGTGKAATLHTPAVGGEVKCTGFKDEGKVATPTTETGVISTFTGCTSLGKKCLSPGQKAGTIKTNKLKGELGYISAAEHKAGVDLAAETGTVLAEFKCEGLEIVVTGSVVGEVTPTNTFSKTTTTSFKVNGSGYQEYKALEGHAEDVLESEINGSGPFESGQEAAAVNKGEELDLKA
jgi:hypothetical protein